MNILVILGENFYKFDWIIYIWAILTGLLWIFTKNTSKDFNGYLRRDEESTLSQKRELRKLNKKQERLYTLFVNFTSALPLWGMIGTIWSLLNLSGSLNNGENVTNDFLLALTSTLVGAVASLIAKVADSFLSPSIEENHEIYLMRLKEKNLYLEEMREKDETKQNIT